MEKHFLLIFYRMEKWNYNLFFFIWILIPLEFCILESIRLNLRFLKILKWKKISIVFKLKCKILLYCFIYTLYLYIYINIYKYTIKYTIYLYIILNCLDIQEGFEIKKILMNSNSIGILYTRIRYMRFWKILK